jgi:hypothetical protein
MSNGVSSQFAKSSQTTAAATRTLNELLDYFARKSAEPAATVDFTTSVYDTNDDHFELDIDELMSVLNLNGATPSTAMPVESELAEFGDNFAKFCTQFLQESTRFTYEQLLGDKNLLQNIHHFVYFVFKHDMSKLANGLYNTSADQTSLSSLNANLNNLELVYTYLLKQPPDVIKFEKLSVFLLSSLSALLLVNKYLKKYPAEEIDRRTKQIMYKIFNLLEAKPVVNFLVNSANDPQVRLTVVKTCKLCAYFAEHVKEDAKLYLLLILKWVFKLVVTNRFFLNPNSVENEDEVADLIRKLFDIIIRDLCLKIDIVRTKLESLNDPMSSHSPSSQVSTNSQSTKNVSQEVIKAIKAGAYLLKMFVGFAKAYFDLMFQHERDNFFWQVSYVLGMLNYICLYEYKLPVVVKLALTNDNDFGDDDKENVTDTAEECFRLVKRSIFKELCTSTEELFQFVEANKLHREFLFKTGGLRIKNFIQTR